MKAARLKRDKAQLELERLARQKALELSKLELQRLELELALEQEMLEKTTLLREAQAEEAIWNDGTEVALPDARKEFGTEDAPLLTRTETQPEVISTHARSEPTTGSFSVAGSKPIRNGSNNTHKAGSRCDTPSSD